MIKRKSVSLFLPILFYVFYSSTAWAQLSIGLRGGVNFASLAVEKENTSGLQARTVPNFALLLNYQLNPLFNIQVEPGFSRRGTKVNSDQSTYLGGKTIRYVSEGNISLNYFELPVLFQYRPQLGPLEGIISFGPEVRFLTGPMKTKSRSKSYIDEKLQEDETTEESFSGDDGAKKFDFGLAGGIGLAYPVGSLKLFAEGRYHLGLNNLVKESEDNTAKIHNRGASVQIGVLFPIGK